MFLPWTIFAVNIVLAVFQLLLLCAVGALVSIYSRFGGEYANSIRWAHQGGYAEMVKSLYNSSNSIPARAKLAMVITILASLAASLTDKGVAHFITPAQRMGRPDRVVKVTPQFSALSWNKIFSGWTTSIRYGDDIVQAMTAMITNSRNLPDAEHGREYIPHLAGFEMPCQQQTPTLRAMDWYNPTPMTELIKGGCMDIVILMSAVGSAADLTNATVTQRSVNQWSVALPGFFTVKNQTLGVMNAFQSLVDNQCSLQEPIMPSSHIDPQGGVGRLPTTVTTKCILPSGDVSVLSLSTVRFSTGYSYGFLNSSTSIFLESGQDALFMGMDTLIQTSGPKTSIHEYPLLMEIKSLNDGASYDTLVCTFTYSGGFPYPDCIYANINTFVAKPLLTETDILSIRQGKPFESSSLNSNAMTIEHIPTFINNTERSKISILQIQNDTKAVSQYMAALGQNFYADYDENRMYVVYDTLDIEKGLEIPLWLLALMATSIVVCLILSVTTVWLLDSKYTDSLYTSLSAELRGLPGLVPTKAKPVEFAGQRVFSRRSSGDGYEMESSSNKALLMDTL
ncbi:hypothetical protein EDD11_009773 [Mortierella claussenii]|nr:hypothetical protein EDD11_009773 [Mortierella claussenii]